MKLLCQWTNEALKPNNTIARKYFGIDRYKCYIVPKIIYPYAIESWSLYINHEKSENVSLHLMQICNDNIKSKEEAMAIADNYLINDGWKFLDDEKLRILI